MRWRCLRTVRGLFAPDSLRRWFVVGLRVGTRVVRVLLRTLGAVGRHAKGTCTFLHRGRTDSRPAEITRRAVLRTVPYCGTYGTVA